MINKSALMCVCACVAAVMAIGAPVVVPGSTAAVDRVDGVLAAANTVSQEEGALKQHGIQLATPPEWSPIRNPEDRRQVWEAIQDEAETDWREPMTGSVYETMWSHVDTQSLRGVLLGQEPPKPKVEIPIGTSPSKRASLFANLSPAGFFNLGFAFLILIILAVKARSRG